VKTIAALFLVALGLWLGGFLAVVTTGGAPAAVALGAFGLLSTFSAAVTRIGSQQSDQIVNAAEPTLSRATGSAATSNHTSRR
jgi:hypothetical protein